MTPTDVRTIVDTLIATDESVKCESITFKFDLESRCVEILTIVRARTLVASMKIAM